jgi:hypothetical protein
MVNPIPPAAQTINGVAASYVKTPGVGGYIKMMYFNPNHGLASKSALPPPPPAVSAAPVSAMGGPTHSFVLGQPLPPLPTSPPPGGTA